MDGAGAMVYNGIEERGRRPVEITQELVERIAHLGRLTLSEDEKARMSAQLEDILGSMTALETLCLEENELEQGGEA